MHLEEHMAAQRSTWQHRQAAFHLALWEGGATQQSPVGEEPAGSWQMGEQCVITPQKDI